MVKPLDFTTLKGYVPAKERAIQSQLRFQKDFIVTQGSKFYRDKDQPQGKAKQLGQDFRTSFKMFDDCNRVHQSQIANPIMSMGTSAAFRSTGGITGSSSAQEAKLKMQKKRELGWRKEPINTREFSSWSQTKITNPSKDPY